MTMSDAQAPKAILFDWDNTLVDTWPTIHDALNHTLRAMGQPEWPIEQVRAQVKQSMRDSFPRLFGQAWEEAAELYQSRFRAIHLERLQPLPDAQAMLKALHGTGVYMGIVSNKKGENLRKEVAHLGWHDYLDATIGAQDAPHDKPHPAPAQLALAKAPAHLPEEVWFVGDTSIDLECAHAIGATTVLYGHDMPIDGMFEGFAVHHYAPNHRVLEHLLLSAVKAAA